MTDRLSSILGGGFRTVESTDGDGIAANALATSIGCVYIRRTWPTWSKADTLQMLDRWTRLVEWRRAALGRPLEYNFVSKRSDFADCERALGVAFAQLAYNCRRHGLPRPATEAACDRKEIPEMPQLSPAAAIRLAENPFK